ncbi:MAG: hypothetical protein EOO64_00670 [Massilia sp.]|nr:MAG: hypothetical protein EOO64_00670 [Massilia sp.]
MLELWNRHTQQMEPADLIGRIELEDVTSFVQRWHPPMQAKIDDLRNAGKLTRDEVKNWNVADAHWQWPAKVTARSSHLEWASYALRCGGDTQGLMFVNLVRRCRLPAQFNQHMVYVDLVSTAPWNRPRLMPNPLYGGVGVTMVTEAVIRSLDEGFDGRIGLHALPGAEPLYQKLKMDCLGPDPKYDNLPYFEMTPQQAAALLSSGAP